MNNGVTKSILTPRGVARIKRLLIQGVGIKELATAYDVRPQSIRRIWTGETWTNVEPEPEDLGSVSEVNKEIERALKPDNELLSQHQQDELKILNERWARGVPEDLQTDKGFTMKINDPWAAIGGRPKGQTK